MDYPTTTPGSVDRSMIKVKALAVIFDDDSSHHAVFRAQNTAGEHFSRPLGGGIELGERAVDAVVREIREELEAELLDPELLGVVENIFELDGELGHEVDFMFVGRLAHPLQVVPPEGRSFDDVGTPSWVEWRSVSRPDDTVALYPPVLQQMIDDYLQRRPSPVA